MSCSQIRGDADSDEVVARLAADPTSLHPFTVANQYHDGKPPPLRDDDGSKPRITFGCQQDHRIVDRICELCGIELRQSTKSLMGFWTSVQARAKPLQVTPPFDPYTMKLLMSGEYS